MPGVPSVKMTITKFFQVREKVKVHDIGIPKPFFFFHIKSHSAAARHFTYSLKTQSTKTLAEKVDPGWAAAQRGAMRQECETSLRETNLNGRRVSFVIIPAKFMTGNVMGERVAPPRLLPPAALPRRRPPPRPPQRPHQREAVQVCLRRGRRCAGVTAVISCIMTICFFATHRDGRQGPHLH